MEKISLSSIAEALAAKGGITREAASNFMHAFIKTIEKGLQENGMVKVKGLGTFKLLEVSDRSSVDVNTGERIIIKGYRKVTFTPDSAMKEFVNRPFAHFEPTELNDGYPDEEPIVEESASDDMDEVEVVEERPAQVEETSEETLVAEEPNVEAVVAEAPVVEDPIAETPIVKEPSVDEPSVDEPVTEEPVAEEAVEEEIVTEEVRSVDVVPMVEDTSFVDSVVEEEIEPAEEPVAPVAIEDTPKVPRQASKKKRRALLWIFILLLVAALAFVFYWFVVPMFTSESLRKEVTIEQDEIKVKPNLEEELGVEWGNALKNDEQQLENAKSDSVDSAEGKVEAKVEERVVAEYTSDPIAPEFTFYITESLLVKNIKEITPADTTDYAMEDTLAVHKLKSGETIIQLSNKYYGDKRLWPYIVAYNRMERFNSVAIGQEILIPRLRNR